MAWEGAGDRGCNVSVWGVWVCVVGVLGECGCGELKVWRVCGRGALLGSVDGRPLGGAEWALDIDET